MGSMNSGNFHVREMFPCINRLSLQSLVLSGDKNNTKFFKNQIIELASQAGMVRAEASGSRDKVKWMRAYEGE